MAEEVLSADVMLAVEIRQSVLSKQLSKQEVNTVLEFLKSWNINRPAPDK